MVFSCFAGTVPMDPALCSPVAGKAYMSAPKASTVSSHVKERIQRKSCFGNAKI